MNRKVQIYIEGERLELFEDEKISVTSSIQNVQDIAKTFTDLSQSFTVPASEHNNAIFKHFYENAIDDSYDYQVRRDARIEIDLIPFRTGKIQLEKANVKKGLAQSYSITFYGDLRTLQDYFGEDKLNTLDMSPYTHEYTGAEVKTRITSSSSYDIRYPLISSSRVWQYGGGGAQDGGTPYAGGTGGSGVVILRYVNGVITIGAGLTGSTVTSGGYQITTITAGTGNVSWV